LEYSFIFQVDNNIVARMKRSHEEAIDNSDNESHTTGTKRDNVDDDTGACPLEKDDIEDDDDDDDARDVNVEGSNMASHTNRKRHASLRWPYNPFLSSKTGNGIAPKEPSPTSPPLSSPIRSKSGSSRRINGSYSSLETRHVSPEKATKQVDPDHTNVICQDDEAENNAGAPPATPRIRNPDVASSGRSARNPDSSLKTRVDPVTNATKHLAPNPAGEIYKDMQDRKMAASRPANTIRNPYAKPRTVQNPNSSSVARFVSPVCATKQSVAGRTVKLDTDEEADKNTNSPPWVAAIRKPHESSSRGFFDNPYYSFSKIRHDVMLEPDMEPTQLLAQPEPEDEMCPDEDVKLFHEPEPEDEMHTDEEDESSVKITNQSYSSSKTRSNFQIGDPRKLDFDPSDDICDESVKNDANPIYLTPAPDHPYNAVKTNETISRPGNAARISYEDLNPKQTKAVELAKAGRNVFITGPAGTGKSVVLRHIIDHLESKYEGQYGRWVGVASTGIAALTMAGGMTIHRFAGCGVPKVAADFDKAWEGEKRQAWRQLEVLVVEEVSMISGEFFDRLSKVVGAIRENKDKPFGGIQLIVCGDFLQLPPISMRIDQIRAQKKTLASQRKSCILHCDLGFTFQAKAWQQAAMAVVDLDEVYRQGNVEFVKILHQIRKGKVTADAVAFLKKCDRPLPFTYGVRPTILYAKNKDVNQENINELLKLPGDEYMCMAKDSVKLEDGYDEDPNRYSRRSKIERELSLSSFFDECIAQKELRLKIGAQVMLIKNEMSNDEGKLVNGSRGKVIGFSPPTTLNSERITSEKTTTMSDEEELYPVVQFLNGRIKLVGMELFESRRPGLGSCIREAIPLKLAWAITVHKSQGMTLDYVKADLRGVFTEAQTYVALSRASDENGLELRNFSAAKVRADSRALEFYDNPDGKFPLWGFDEEEVKPEILAAPSPTPGWLEGLAFVFTGEFNKLPRDDAEALVKACGGVIRKGAVSGKTNFLVIGERMDDGRSVMSGAKYRKAEAIIAGVNKSKLQIIDTLGLFGLVTSTDRPQNPAGA
jgi:ATP-dependent DNA helicase PIF1